MLSYTIFSETMPILKLFVLSRQDFYQRLESLALFQCHPYEKLRQAILYLESWIFPKKWKSFPFVLIFLVP